MCYTAFLAGLRLGVPALDSQPHAQETHGLRSTLCTREVPWNAWCHALKMEVDHREVLLLGFTPMSQAASVCTSTSTLSSWPSFCEKHRDIYHWYIFLIKIHVIWTKEGTINRTEKSRQACFMLLQKKKLTLKRHKVRDLPGGPVAKTSRSQCRGPGFNPWSGN